MVALTTASTYVSEIRVQEVRVLVVELVQVLGTFGHHFIVLFDEAGKKSVHGYIIG